MAIFKQNKLFGFLLIILFVGSNCSGKGVNTPDTEVLPTTRISEHDMDGWNGDASAAQEMVVEMQVLVTHSSLQPPTTHPGEDLVSQEVATQLEDPSNGSKRHKCGFIDSCVGRCGSGPSDRDSIYTYIVSTEKRMPIRTGYLCFCDSRCSLYGDCCSDYDVQCQCNGNELNGKTDLTQETDVLVEHEGIIVVSPTIPNDASSTGPQEQSGELLDDPSIRRDMLECKHLDEVEFGSLLVETKCHPDWKNKNIETLCTNIDYRDDIAKLFVQGGDHITYRNIFCAECNFVKVFNFWIQDAYCYGELPTSVYEQPERLSNYLRKNCMTKFRVPYGYVFRPCLKMVDSCPKGISQESKWVEQNCVSGHLSVVTADTTSLKLWGSTLYRNSVCAECNGVDESLIRCPTKDMLKKHFLRNSTYRNDSKPSNGDSKITNRIVTNYNMAAKDQSSTVIYGGNGLVVPIVDTCEDGQVFDPYLGNCRQLYCSDGYVLVKQDCVPTKASDQLNDDDIITMVEAITAVINETVGLEDELVITVKICMEWDYSEHEGNNNDDVKAPAPGKGKLPPDNLVFNSSVWDIYVSPIHPNDSFADHELTDFACEVTVTMVVANPEEMTRNNAKQFAEILGKLSDLNNANDMHVYVNDVYVKTPEEKDCAFVEILNGNLTDLNYLIGHCKNGNLTIVESSDFTIYTIGADNDVSSCPIVYVNSTSRVYDCYENYVFGYDSTIPVDEQTFGALVCDSQSPIDPKCERILLNETEYDTLPNGSVITLSGIIYDPPNYHQTTEGVLICNMYVNVISETVVIFFDFSRAQTIMTYTGLVISSVCLSVTLLTYVIFGELRTLPGLHIMSLIVASIGGNITFIISLSLTPGSLECQVTAVIMHYFFLTRVFWTNAIVVHAFQTFGPKVRGCVHRSFDVLSKTSACSRVRQHIPYALYAWCTPIPFTALGSAWHFCACGPLPVYYGMYFSCWIADPFSFLYLFVLPMALVLTTNAILFVPIVYSLHTARKQSSKKLSSLKGRDMFKDANKKPGELAIYAKLSTTAGFSWMFGILAAFTDQDFLWYLFILSMSLEGLFIFFSFFCNKRVKNLYSKRFGKKSNGMCLVSRDYGQSRSAYTISHQVERRTSGLPKETFTTLTV